MQTETLGSPCHWLKTEFLKFKNSGCHLNKHGFSQHSGQIAALVQDGISKKRWTIGKKFSDWILFLTAKFQCKLCLLSPSVNKTKDIKRPLWTWKWLPSIFQFYNFKSKVTWLLFVFVSRAPSCPLTTLTETKISQFLVLCWGDLGRLDFTRELALKFEEYSHYGRQSLEMSQFLWKRKTLWGKCSCFPSMLKVLY